MDKIGAAIGDWWFSTLTESCIWLASFAVRIGHFGQISILPYKSAWAKLLNGCFKIRPPAREPRVIFACGRGLLLARFEGCPCNSTRQTCGKALILLSIAYLRTQVGNIICTEHEKVFPSLDIPT